MLVLRTTFGLLLLGMGLAGCGGSSGSSGDPGTPGGGGPNFQTVDIAPDVANSGFTSGAGALAITNALNIGDDPANDLEIELLILVDGDVAEADHLLQALGQRSVEDARARLTARSMAAALLSRTTSVLIDGSARGRNRVDSAARSRPRFVPRAGVDIMRSSGTRW